MTYFTALTAVLALHSPDAHGQGRCDDPECETWCNEDSMEYPCPTARIVAEELGVTL